MPLTKITPVKKSIPKSTPKITVKNPQPKTQITPIKRQLPNVDTSPQDKDEPEPKAKVEVEVEVEAEAEVEPVANTEQAKVEVEVEANAEQETEASESPIETKQETVNQEASAEASEDDESSEEELDIHPQLKDLLMYLADDEHISIAKTNMLATKQDIKELSDQINSLSQLLKSLPQSMNAHAPSQPRLQPMNTHSPPQPQPQQSKPEEKVETIQRITTTEPKHPISQMIDTLADNGQTHSDVMDTYNHTFNATFIMDFHGNGKNMAESLKKLGFHNCYIIQPEFTNGKDTDNNKVFAHYLRDTIDVARERNMECINVLSDNLLIHSQFATVYAYLKQHIDETNWDVLQYCCTTHRYRTKVGEFDWEFYLKTNPELGEKGICNEIRAKQNWRSRGIRHGKVGRAAVMETTCTDALAFALKINNDSYERLSQAIQLSLSNGSHPLQNYKESSALVYMTSPNLFIKPGFGSKIQQTIKWTSMYNPLT